MATAESLRFAVPGAGEVSALLIRPAKANWILALAHGAGAGMRHAFMEALAEELVETNGCGIMLEHESGAQLGVLEIQHSENAWMLYTL